jgi:hypothetical protein
MDFLSCGDPNAISSNTSMPDPKYLSISQVFHISPQLTKHGYLVFGTLIFAYNNRTE